MPRQSDRCLYERSSCPFAPPGRSSPGRGPCRGTRPPAPCPIAHRPRARSRIGRYRRQAAARARRSRSTDTTVMCIAVAGHQRGRTRRGTRCCCKDRDPESVPLRVGRQEFAGQSESERIVRGVGETGERFANTEQAERDRLTGPRPDGWNSLRRLDPDRPGPDRTGPVIPTGAPGPRRVGYWRRYSRKATASTAGARSRSSAASRS